VGPTLVVRATLRDCVMLNDGEVVVINVVASKEVGNEHQKRGLSGARLSNEQDGGWRVRVRLVCWCHDVAFRERLYVARSLDMPHSSRGVFVGTHVSLNHCRFGGGIRIW